MINKIVFFSLLLLLPSIYAANSTPNYSPLQRATSPSFCPDPNDPQRAPIKQGAYWTAPGGWISYTASFNTKITKFIQAQWQGVNIGSIICIYQGAQQLTFPIVLQQKDETPTAQPTPASSNQWQSNQSNDLNCYSDSVYDCPFFIEQPTAVQDPYQVLSTFKQQDQSP